MAECKWRWRCAVCGLKSLSRVRGGICEDCKAVRRRIRKLRHECRDCRTRPPGWQARIKQLRALAAKQLPLFPALDKKG